MGKQATAWLVALLFVSGCGDDGEPFSSGGVNVRTSVVRVTGHVPPANPMSGSATPADLNQATALVYTGDAAAAVEQVLVLMPGFLAGANTFDYMARRLVERSRGRVGVWVVDRRSNALEDQRGLDVAEADADPDLAKAYYFGGQPLQGETFAGFLTDNGSDLSYLSEWGIVAHVEDLDALIAAARSRHPRAEIFLGGHSLGASIAPIYAAWDFGGRAGFEGLSGLVLLEGAPSPGAGGEIPDRESYESTGIMSGLGSASLASLRSGDPTATLPFIGRDLFVAAEIVAMRATRRLGAPHDRSPDTDIIGSFFQLIFGVTAVPELTNRAAVGFGFDDDFQPLSFVRAAMGETDGPVEPNTSLAAQLFGAETVVPSDPATSYRWIDRGEQESPEPTDIDVFAEMLFRGPSNFIEWYFPARLTLDVSVTASLDVRSQDDWRREVYGMAITENARVDLPVFAVGGEIGLASDPARFAAYGDSISPTLRDGSTRAEAEHGFVITIMPGHAHIDPVSADDTGAGNGVFQPILDWMNEATG